MNADAKKTVLRMIPCGIYVPTALDGKDLAFAFFRPAELDGETISGQAFHTGANGAPILAMKDLGEAVLYGGQCQPSSRADT